MIEVVSVSALLARPRYRDAYWLDHGSWWTPQDKTALAALCEYNAQLAKCADSLGRAPSAIVWKARDDGLKLPPDWRAFISPKRALKQREIEIPLQYPYIKTVRGEHAELLAVNALVPRGLPEHWRADVCQEIMLALWMKQTTLDELRDNRKILNGFIRGFKEANLEGRGYALSLDKPLHDGRSWYDILPDDSESKPGS